MKPSATAISHARSRQSCGVEFSSQSSGTTLSFALCPLRVPLGVQRSGQVTRRSLSLIVIQSGAPEQIHFLGQLKNEKTGNIWNTTGNSGSDKYKAQQLKKGVYWGLRRHTCSRHKEEDLLKDDRGLRKPKGPASSWGLGFLSLRRIFLP